MESSVPSSETADGPVESLLRLEMNGRGRRRREDGRRG